MPGISKHTSENYGSLSRLHYALQRDLEGVLDFDYERDSLQLSQAQFDSLYSRLHFTRRNAGYDFKKVPDPAGDQYPNMIEASFPKDRPEIREHLERTENSKVCFMFRYVKDDQWYILPFATESTDFRGGRDVTDSNVFTFAWESLLSYPAVPITII